LAALLISYILLDFVQLLQRNEEIFVRHLNMSCLFTKNYWSIDEVISKQCWTVLFSDFEELSNKKSPISVRLIPWENGKCNNSSSEEHLKN
jgi:hypothetical protein